MPAPTDALEPIDAALLARARALGPALRAYYAEQSLSRAQDAVRDVVTDANKYFDETAPWTLAKSPDDAARFHLLDAPKNPKLAAVLPPAPAAGEDGGERAFDVLPTGGTLGRVKRLPWRKKKRNELTVSREQWSVSTGKWCCSRISRA